MTDQPSPPPTRVILLMGVCGCGKSTIGRLLSEHLDWDMVDGDNLHPPENIQKMASGNPLNDEDRQPWLLTIRQIIDRHLATGRGLVIICSALKQRYRDLLMQGTSGVSLVHLHGEAELLHKRMSDRKGHYMKSGMLESQLQTLEVPTDALTINIAQTPEAMFEEILQNLRF